MTEAEVMTATLHLPLALQFLVKWSILEEDFICFMVKNMQD